MRSRTSVIRLGIVLLLTLLATPAMAGGWAEVTLDKVAESPTAGTSISLGFMVRQHGVTPIDENPFEGGPLKPYLTATNSATGESFRVDARKEGPVGHFVADVTFPSEGSWRLEITPPPFAGTVLEPLSVLPAPAKAPQTEAKVPQAQAKAPQAEVAESTPAPVPVAQPRGTGVWIGAALALAALALLLFVSRGAVAARLSRARRPLAPR